MGRRRASPRVRANRLNAKRSTGPKSTIGKQRSARNSFLHGLSAKPQGFSSHPDMDRFLKLLCEGDERSQVIEAARELADAQFDLNTARQYRLILQTLKAKGRSMPEPGSELLNDPIIREFMDYMTTGEPVDFGVPQKADHRLHKRLLNFIFKQAGRSKDPDKELIKLNRYEWMALRRRLAAIEKLDALRASPLSEEDITYSPVAQPRRASGPLTSAVKMRSLVQIKIFKTKPI